MRHLDAFRLPAKLGGMLAVSILLFSPASKAQVNATAGAETKDEAVQANGFFPNEIWIFENDSITWTFAPKNEVHTVTFLAPSQPRPSAPPPVGPPTFPASCGPEAASATYSGTNCVSSSPLSGGATFTVTFPNAGNYKLVCLVHTDMNGTVHVLPNDSTANAALVHSRRFYDEQGKDEAAALLGDNDRSGDGHHDWDDDHGDRDSDHSNAVVAGIGEIAATGGGTQYRAVVRFLSGTIRIHVGESVTWTNLDPTEPHTVTFGTEPAGFIPTIPKGVAPATDGRLSGAIVCSTTPCDQAFEPQGDQPSSAASFINSGFLQAQAPDRTGSNQLPPGTTRMTITFNNPGTYYYHCALHDVDGMNGKVVVEQ